MQRCSETVSTRRAIYQVISRWYHPPSRFLGRKITKGKTGLQIWLHGIARFPPISCGKHPCINRVLWANTQQVAGVHTLVRHSSPSWTAQIQQPLQPTSGFKPSSRTQWERVQFVSVCKAPHSSSRSAETIRLARGKTTCISSVSAQLPKAGFNADRGPRTISSYSSSCSAETIRLVRGKTRCSSSVSAQFPKVGSKADRGPRTIRSWASARDRFASLPK